MRVAQSSQGHADQVSGLELGMEVHRIAVSEFQYWNKEKLYQPVSEFTAVFLL
jgi:hypothetical protein